MTAVTIGGVEYKRGAELFTTPDVAKSLVFNKAAVIDNRQSATPADAPQCGRPEAP